MANGFQRAIYNLANAVPLGLMTALAWYLEFKTYLIPITLLVLSSFVTILFVVCFYYGKNNCTVKNINVSKFKSIDSWVVAYVISYILPFSYIVISNYYVVSLMVVAIMLILVVIPAVMALPNIILYFSGYHFYEIETESTGVGDYILISKRKQIRNKTDIKTVTRVFEKLLIDTKGDK